MLRDIVKLEHKSSAQSPDFGTLKGFYSGISMYLAPFIVSLKHVRRSQKSLSAA